MIIAGIDPGQHGAIAIVNETQDVQALVDLPLTTHPILGEVVDVRKILEVIAGADLVVLEDVGGTPWQANKAGRVAGYQSTFRFGENAGAIKAALAMTDTIVLLVAPRIWKAGFMLTRAPDGKKASLRLARAMYPAASDLLARVKDDGRAEALLIATYGVGRMGYRLKLKRLSDLEAKR